MRQLAELSGEPATILRPEHELFAACVASGMSYRKSARRAGFHEDHGFRLMQRPAISDRVEELQSAPVDERLRAQIQAELLVLHDRVPRDAVDANRRANIALQLKILSAVEKVSGWSVRKQHPANTKLSWRELSREEQDAAIAAELDRLAPGACERIRRTAAGEDNPADGETGCAVA